MVRLSRKTSSSYSQSDFAAGNDISQLSHSPQSPEIDRFQPLTELYLSRPISASSSPTFPSPPSSPNVSFSLTLPSSSSSVTEYSPRFSTPSQFFHHVWVTFISLKVSAFHRFGTVFACSLALYCGFVMQAFIGIHSNAPYNDWGNLVCFVQALGAFFGAALFPVSFVLFRQPIVPILGAHSFTCIFILFIESFTDFVITYFNGLTLGLFAGLMTVLPLHFVTYSPNVHLRSGLIALMFFLGELISNFIDRLHFGNTTCHLWTCTFTSAFFALVLVVPQKRSHNSRAFRDRTLVLAHHDAIAGGLQSLFKSGPLLFASMPLPRFAPTTPPFTLTLCVIIIVALSIHKAINPHTIPELPPKSITLLHGVSSLFFSESSAWVVYQLFGVVIPCVPFYLTTLIIFVTGAQHAVAYLDGNFVVISMQITAQFFWLLIVRCCDVILHQFGVTDDYICVFRILLKSMPLIVIGLFFWSKIGSFSSSTRSFHLESKI